MTRTSEPRTRAALGLNIDGTHAKLSLEELRSLDNTPVSLSSLDFVGQSLLDQIADAAGPELASNPNPGRIDTANAQPVATAISALEPDALYLLQYGISALGDVTAFFLPNSGPFANADLRATVGVHKMLVKAKDSAMSAFMSLNGDISFDFLSLRRVEWSFVLPDVGPNLSINPTPGKKGAGSQGISSLISAPEVGAEYEIEYQVTENDGCTLFWSAGSPFTGGNPPSTVGTHVLLKTAQDADVVVFRKSGGGSITIPTLSVRKVLTGNDELSWDVAVGETSVRQSVRTRAPGALYVAPWGSDKTGTGAQDSPFANPQAAADVARPGDTIFLRSGLYKPFSVNVSGTSDNPITFTAFQGEERQAIIDGTGMSGVSGVRIVGQNYITVQNLTIREITDGNGISIGNSSGTTGHHVIEGNRILAIDESAVRCVGISPGSYAKDQTDIFTENVTIRGNEISDAYRKGDAGGANEVITVGGGCRNIITEGNDISNSKQYGIDYKRGVDGGIIRNNRIWGIEKHAIYLDTSVSYLRNLQIHNNMAWDCANGIVLTREALGDEAGTQAYENIDIWNNTFFDMLYQGIFAHAHPGDRPTGTISNIRIRFNTVYNCGLSGTREEIRVYDWHSGDYEANGVVSNFEVVGNIFWRDPTRGAPRTAGKTAMIESSAFTYADNIDDSDPLFAMPDRAPVIGTGFLPTIASPDFTLGAGSPGIGAVAAVYASSLPESHISGMSAGDTTNAGVMDFGS